MYDIMRLNMFKSSTYYPGNFSKQKSWKSFSYRDNADQCELDALI